MKSFMNQLLNKNQMWRKEVKKEKLDEDCVTYTGSEMNQMLFGFIHHYTHHNIKTLT